MRKVILTMLVALGFALGAIAQDRTISGKVTDEKGAPLPGVSVTSSDNKKGTQTDANGNFSITVGTITKTLTVSSIGYDSQRVNARSGNVNVKMIAVNGTLEDVVVTGIRNIKRSEYAGAATRIRKADIENKPFVSFNW
jgi:TonB-dependent starch-binding outer membrane protein SusC